VLAAAVLAVLYLGLQGLRWPEPLGLDQSLFALYGHWMTRGLRLYRDLWDSKPPGIFGAYAVADRLVGMAHSARLLDMLAATASGVLAFLLLLPEAGLGAACAGAWLTAILPSAPPFGGPMVAGQAEVLMAPLLLGAALAARRGGRSTAFVAGLLLGAAASLKLVALVLLPLPWIFAPPAARRNPRLTLLLLAGLSVVPGAWLVTLAAQGTWHDAVQAILIYPRAYAAETASRMSLLGALGRGFERFARGLPVVMLLGLLGATSRHRSAFARAACVWMGLALAGIVLQRQMAGYHEFLLVTPLGLLAGLGAAWAWRKGTAVWRASMAGRPAMLAALVPLALLFGIAMSLEGRLWVHQYTAHRQLTAGWVRHNEFMRRLGGPGPAWLEAEVVASEATEFVKPTDAVLVWGLAPAVYVKLGCRPATRYAFHQTLLVEGSPLSNRWPGVIERRAELLERMRRDPPHFVVVVRGDASGLEPTDSQTELHQFPELEKLLEMEYHQLCATKSYTLLVR
jgi:hypothetical protein